jgi:predicted O-linked N-acetylglucosamine transferase (SPINDLY family)
MRHSSTSNDAAGTLQRALEAQTRGRLDEARALFEAAIASDDRQAAALYSLAALDANDGRWEQALAGFDRALACVPGFAPALAARSQVNQRLGRIPQAVADAEAALKLDPGSSALAAQLAVLRASLPPGQPAATETAALPAFPAPLIETMGRAQSLQARQQTDAAVAEYAGYLRTGDPAFAYAALYNAGVVLSQAGRRLEAEAYLRQAVVLNPDFGLAQVNLGLTIETNGRAQDALAQWRSALERPALQAPAQQGYRVQLLNHIGRLSEQQRDYPGAEAALTQSLMLQPRQPPVLHHWVHLRQKQCVWPVIAGLPISREDVMTSASALAMLGLSDDPADQLASSRRFVAEKVGRFPRSVPRGHRYGHDRLRIGYLSSDLSMHAVSLLTVELFERHRRDQVEVHAFCWSKEDGTPFRERVRRAFDRYHRIDGMDDAGAADLIQAQEIDVLVDLHGLTSNARPNIVARGVAPLQVAFLGFPGPTALPHMDFVVADPFIFPDALRPHFTEEPLILPTLYQCSDSQRPIGRLPTRAQLGLPDQAFVFCAFNNNFKFTPEVFEAWMRILRRVPDAVLWLLEDNRWSRENLQRAAQAHGVDASRLLFAGRVMPADYLARFAVADLFLDTCPYNAGTTANDALWAGLPLLTLSGRTYVSRMAGSLLTSAGLPELVTTTLADYEDRAVALAQDRAALAGLRQRLTNEKAEGRLFSTDRFVAEFETALQSALLAPPAVSGRGRQRESGPRSRAGSPAD